MKTKQKNITRKILVVTCMWVLIFASALIRVIPFPHTTINMLFAIFILVSQAWVTLLILQHLPDDLRFVHGVHVRQWRRLKQRIASRSERTKVKQDWTLERKLLWMLPIIAIGFLVIIINIFTEIRINTPLIVSIMCCAHIILIGTRK